MLGLFSRTKEKLFPFKCQFAMTTPMYRDKLPQPPPELPLEIWLEIFHYATYVRRSATIKPPDPFAVKHTSNNVMGTNTPAQAMRTKLALVLVSQSWRRVALQTLYQYIVIRSPTRAKALLVALQAGFNKTERIDNERDPRRHGYGQWTRHIEVYTFTRDANTISHLQVLFAIFRFCPNLHYLSGSWSYILPPEFVQAVSQLYCPSLQGLYWNEMSPFSTTIRNTSASPNWLASFQGLSILDLRHFLGGDKTGKESDMTSPTLPCVQDLVVSSHHRSLRTATSLSLPALRNLTVEPSTRDPSGFGHLWEPFLEEHGSLLISVDLLVPSMDSEVDETARSRRPGRFVNPEKFLEPGKCPNLHSMAFPVASPTFNTHCHTSLRRIGLRDVRAEGLYPDKPSQAKAHLKSITSSQFPNLEQIVTVGFLVDADADSLLKDIFIWWVEKFEADGIDFLDGEGILWAYTDPEPKTEIKHEEGPVVVAGTKSKSPIMVVKESDRPGLEVLAKIEVEEPEFIAGSEYPLKVKLDEERIRPHNQIQ